MYKKGIKEDLSLSPKIAWTFSRASSDTGPFGEKDDVQVLYNLCIAGIVQIGYPVNQEIIIDGYSATRMPSPEIYSSQVAVQ